MGGHNEVRSRAVAERSRAASTLYDPKRGPEKVANCTDLVSILGTTSSASQGVILVRAHGTWSLRGRVALHHDWCQRTNKPTEL
jgi:hypothetical protein